MRWWVELVIGALALVGLWVTLDKAAAGIGRAWEWARRDRVTPLLACICGPDETGEDIDVNPDCPEHGYGWGDEDEELPPERTQEELGFSETRRVPTFLERLEAKRERLASAAEAEHRAAYESCGFEFPSGLMARVRELTP